MKSVIAQLSLHSFQVPVHLGVSEQERRHPQDVIFDLDLYFEELPPGCHSDSLSDTICYDVICKLIREVCIQRPYQLIESLAKDTYDALSSKMSNPKIRLRVTKIAPPIVGLRGGSSFTIHPSEPQS